MWCAGQSCFGVWVQEQCVLCSSKRFWRAGEDQAVNPLDLEGGVGEEYVQVGEAHCHLTNSDNECYEFRSGDRLLVA